MVISGQINLEIQQTAIYRATTRWGPTPTSNYIWTVADDNESCAVDGQTNRTVQVTGVAEGTCTLSAEDLNAGGAKAWLEIAIIGD